MRKPPHSLTISKSENLEVQFKPPLTDWDGFTLIALRCWPGNAAKQMDLLRACFPIYLAKRQEQFPEVYATPEFWKMTRDASDALGGWSAIADAPRYSELKAEIWEIHKGGILAGIALTLAEQMIRQGLPKASVSINRLAYLLDEFGEHLIKTRIPKDTFMRAWMKYKSVAHLWAAYLAATGWWTGEGGEDPSLSPEEQSLWLETQVMDQLLFAQQFYTFGTAFRPERSQGSLLDPNTTLLLKAEVEGPPFELSQFSDVIQGALKAYPKHRPRLVRNLSH